MTRLLVLTFAFAVSATARELPEKELVEHIRKEMGEGKYVGVIIIGLVDGDQTIVQGFGETAKGSGRAPDEHTLFEISSISKPFVATILVDLALRSDLELTDPVSYYLPRGVQIAAIDGRQITLEDLAVHTAGLPYLPEDYEVPEEVNPYSGYTTDVVELGQGLFANEDGRRRAQLFRVRIRRSHPSALSPHGTFLRRDAAHPHYRSSRHEGYRVEAELRATAVVGGGLRSQNAPYMDQGALQGAGSMFSTLARHAFLRQGQHGKARYAAV